MKGYRLGMGGYIGAAFLLLLAGPAASQTSDAVRLLNADATGDSGVNSAPRVEVSGFTEASAGPVPTLTFNRQLDNKVGKR
jgi:hypothetical protein